MTQGRDRRRAVVSVARCELYEPGRVRKALEAALEPFGGLGAFVRPGMRVLLKPNFVKGYPAEMAVTTHPAFVEAVARMVLDLGGRPAIGDSPSIFSARHAARACGVEEVARRLGIPVVELDRPVDAGTFSAGGRIHRLRLSGRALDFDAILNLPKFKCHNQMYMSLAAKNLFGLVPRQRKFLWHAKLGKAPEHFAEMIVRVAQAARPALHLVDGIVAMERAGPIFGDPRQLGLILAGTDFSAVDRVGIEVVKADPSKMLTLGAARMLGVGETNLENIDIAGLGIAEAAAPDFVKTVKPTPLFFTPAQIARIVVRNFSRRWLCRG